MKKQIMRAVNATLFSKFFKSTALVLMLSGGYAVAQATPVSEAITNAGPGVGKTVVTHLGSNRESVFFEVKVENTSGEKFTILVKDNLGNTLYRGSFNDREFNRKFRVPKNESDKITFVIRSEDGSKTETFEANSSTRTVEEVIVKKVN